MSTHRMESLAVLALLATLKGQDAHAKLQLARLSEVQLSDLSVAIVRLDRLIEEVYRKAVERGS